MTINIVYLHGKKKKKGEKRETEALMGEGRKDPYAPSRLGSDHQKRRGTKVK